MESQITTKRQTPPNNPNPTEGAVQTSAQSFNSGNDSMPEGMKKQKIIKYLKSYKKDLMKKRIWQIVFALIIVVIIIKCSLRLLFYGGWIDNNISILDIVNVNKSFHYLDKGMYDTIILWIILFISIYIIYKIHKKYCRYNNAITKLEILIKRLELSSDPDLNKPYRLDRELEMIYRILES